MSSRPLSRQYLRNGSISKLALKPSIVDDGLGFEVDGDLVVRILLRAMHQEFDVGFGEADEDHAVLAGVREEDVGEAGSDDGEEAEVGERPGGVLAGAAAAEVLSGDEDLRALVGGIVEDEGSSGWPVFGPSWMRRQSKKRNSP